MRPALCAVLLTGIRGWSGGGHRVEGRQPRMASVSEGKRHSEILMSGRWTMRTRPWATLVVPDTCTVDHENVDLLIIKDVAHFIFVTALDPRMTKRTCSAEVYTVESACTLGFSWTQDLGCLLTRTGTS